MDFSSILILIVTPLLILLAAVVGFLLTREKKS